MNWLLTFWMLLAGHAPGMASLPELLAQDFGSGAPQVTTQPAAGGGGAPTDFTLDAACEAAWLIFSTTDGETEAEENHCDTDNQVFSGTAAFASSTNVPTGTLSGQLSVDLDGVDQEFSIPSDAKYLGENITLCAWVDPDSSGGGRILDKGGSAWYLRMHTSDRLQGWFTSGNEVSSNNAVTAAEGWMFLCERHNNTDDEIQIFKNSTEICNGACTVNGGTPGGADTVGISTTADIDGQILEVWFMSRAVTDSEMCEICRWGLDGNATDRFSSGCDSCTCSGPAC